MIFNNCGECMREDCCTLTNKKSVLVQALLDAHCDNVFPLHDIVQEALDAGYTKERLIRFGIRTMKLERWQAHMMLDILIDGQHTVILN